MKNIFIILFFLLSIGLHTSAQKSPVYAPDGIALNGFDAVAFFIESKPVKGSNTYSFNWSGASWLFSSQQNLELFKKTPEKYAPQYGGYCAYGTSAGHKAPTQAETWTIVNDKLYFNYNPKVKEMWNKNQAALIDSANLKWPMIKDKE